MMVSRVTRYHPATPRKNDTPRKIKSPIPKSRDALKSSIKKSSNEQKSKDEGKPAKKRVSIGGIFKQPIVKETTPRRSRRQKRVVQEHDLFLDYQDAVANSRTVSITEAKAQIAETHLNLLARVNKLDNQHTTFQETITKEAKMIFSTLDEEMVETNTHLGQGSQVKETVQIGMRVLSFKSMVESKREELNKCWKEWEDVQKEIQQLGIEILNVRDTDGKSAWDLMEVQFEEKMSALQNEIDEIESEYIKKMTDSEKELSMRQKNERNKLLAEILAADD